MANNPEVPIDILSDKPLSKRTFNAMVSKLGKLTATSAIAYDYTLAMLSAEHGVRVAKSDRNVTVGRRWKFPTNAGFAPVIYEVTTYGEEAQARLREHDFAKNLLASLWFNSVLTSGGQQNNSFGFSLSLLDEPRPFAFVGNVSGQVQLAEGLENPEGQKLLADAETVGAHLILDHYAAVDSSQDPFEFRLDVTQEVGSDMVKAFGKLASLEMLP